MSRQETAVIIGRNIRKIRKQKEISLKDISTALGYSTTDGYTRLERGVNDIKVPVLIEIATIFGVPLKQLVIGIPELEAISEEPLSEEACIKRYLGESEAEVISLFRKSSEKRQARIIAYLRDQAQLSFLDQVAKKEEE